MQTQSLPNQTNSRASLRPGIAMVIAVGLLLSGCIPNPDLNPKVPLEMPSSFSLSPPHSHEDMWWKEFKDKELDKIIAQCLATNPQLLATWARLEQVQALAKQIDANVWPNIQAELSAGRQSSRNFLGKVQANNAYQTSLMASYEIDIWGKLALARQGAALDVQQMRDQVSSLAMTLVSELVQTYFNLIAQKAILQVLHEQKRTNETFLELMQIRVETGLVRPSDIYQMQGRVAASQGSIVQTQGRIEILQHMLTVMLGKPPKSALNPIPSQLLNLPQAPSTGIPADLLKKRPDIRAAQLAVSSANIAVGQAIALRLPSLRLSASLSASATQLTKLLDDVFYSLASNLGQIVFPMQPINAQVERAEAVVREQVHLFGQAMLQAMMEVENALSQEGSLLQELKQIQTQAEYARATLREERERYLGGITEFLPVLTALISVQNLELQTISLQNQTRINRVQLYRALGGSWANSLQDPKPASVATPKTDSSVSQADTKEVL